jgi:hypothetical protein
LRSFDAFAFRCAHVSIGITNQQGECFVAVDAALATSRWASTSEVLLVKSRAAISSALQVFLVGVTPPRCSRVVVFLAARFARR